jgi:hypothetical protein
VVHQDLPHEARRQAEEVGAALPLAHLLAGDSEVGFVDQGGGLERVADAFGTD